MGLAHLRRFLVVPAILFLVFSAGGSLAAETDPGQAISGQVAMDRAQGEDPQSLLFCYQGLITNPRLVVVDKSRQRVMVFRYVGEMILEREYPCATGEKDGNKVESGDERTPVGIYFTTHRYKDNKVTIFGDKALHLNYPNAFDRESGRKGDGIYIHGTNRPLKPRSSNGCIVMRNEDLHEVEPLIRDNLTPVAVVERLVWPRLNGRIQTCALADGLDLKVLSRTNAKYPPELGLRKGNNGHDQDSKYGDTLASLEKVLHESMRVQTGGVAVYGHRGQWVVVVDQEMKKGKGRAVSAVRRFYIQGTSPAEAKVLQSYWVLADRGAWKRLRSWVPGIMVAAKTTPPKPQAKAKPKKEAALSPPPKALESEPKAEVLAMLRAWIKAWSGKQHKSYISHYAPEFKSADMDLKAWSRQKAYLNRVYKRIRVRAEKIVVDVSGDRAMVTFRQIYRSDWHKDVGYKQLELVKRRGRWLIVSETWHKNLPPQAAAPKRASLRME